MDQDRVQALSRPHPIIIIIITMDTIIRLALDLSLFLRALSLCLRDLILAPQEKILEVALEQSLVAAMMAPRPEQTNMEATAIP